MHDLFIRLVDSLEKNIRRYDLGYWSRYDLFYKRPARITYHLLHIEQLRWLSKVTRRKSFTEVYERWLENVNRTMPLIKLAIERLKYKSLLLLRKIKKVTPLAS